MVKILNVILKLSKLQRFYTKNCIHNTYEKTFLLRNYFTIKKVDDQRTMYLMVLWSIYGSK